MKTCPVCDTPYPSEHRTCPTDGAVLIESRELSPGHLVRGKYRILRKLGQGGMGIVYLAEHLLLGGQLALKFLAVELSQNPQFVKRFRNEARAAYQLRHPNIVEVADLDQDEDGSLFIAMEYIAGASVRTVLRETKGPIPISRALQIGGGVAAGLAAAHARGAVHRDIKPENILLRIEPSGEIQAKVLDFGIAAMTENITNLSRTHGLLLTPEYAAPEQWRGTPATELDGRTDLYALGGVLYEMLTGCTPFHAVNLEGWMYQHLQCTPEPLVTVRPDLCRQYPGLDAIVMRLLSREREQRFDSATAVIAALSLVGPEMAAVPPKKAAPKARPVSEVRAVTPEPAPTKLEMREENASSRAARAYEAPPPLAPGGSQSPPTPARTPFQNIQRLRQNQGHFPPVRGAEQQRVPREIDRTGNEPPPTAPAGSPNPPTAARTPFQNIQRLAKDQDHFLPAQPVRGAEPRRIPREIDRSHNQISAEPSPGRATARTDKPSFPTSSSSAPSKWGTLVGSLALAAVIVGVPAGFFIASHTGITPAAPSNSPSEPVPTVPDVQRNSPYDQAAEQYQQAQGLFEQKRYGESWELFRSSCDAGQTTACNQFGWLYLNGLGVVKDYGQARTYFEKSCTGGAMIGCHNLGWLYQNGLGVTANLAKARSLYQRACKGGIQAACQTLRTLP